MNPDDRVYEASPVKPAKRDRMTNAQVAQLEEAIYEIAREEQPITVRGIYYRVVSRGLVEKTDSGYGKVQRRALLMRQRGQLDYAWVVDGSRWSFRPTTYNSAVDCLDFVSDYYRQSLWTEQPYHLEVWSEKDAISSVVRPVCSEYDVPLLIARGYSSESFLWQTAQDIIRDDKEAVILQVGDHDPDGVAAWESIQSKLQAFAPDIPMYFERIAVTPDQIDEYDLPTRPTKRTSTRFAGFEGESVEVDAMPTPILRGLVRDAIAMWIDDDLMEEAYERQDDERQRLVNAYNHLVDLDSA